MCVIKIHAFIYFLRPPPWYGTYTTGVIQRYRHSLCPRVCYSELQINPLVLCFPFLHSLLLPIRFPLLTWSPPCCDRIRPPCSQVARKLIFPFPSLCSYTPHPKISTPRSSPDPNIHSLGRHREPGSQDRAHWLSWRVLTPRIVYGGELF